MFEWIVISDNAFLESVCIFDFPHTSPSWLTFYLLPAAYLYYNPFLLLTTEYWDTLFLKLVPPLSNCSEISLSCLLSSKFLQHIAIK